MLLMAVYDEWTAVICNMRKSQKQWMQMLRILRREGANTQVSGLFYKAVVQYLLLYGSET